MDGTTPQAPAPAVMAALAAYQPGRSLPQALYTSPEAFAADMAKIHRKHWLFAGYGFEIPNPGDWFVYTVAGSEIIFARGRDMKVRGFHNVCRHRGSRICLEGHGHSSVLACPYHKWSYALDGSLMLDTAKEFGVPKSELGLKQVSVADAGGLLFFSIAENPPDFSEAVETIGRKMKPHALHRVKIAHQAEYRVKANWKVVFENNRECYHCPTNHAEYNLTAYDVERDRAVMDPSLLPAIEAIVAKANERFAALGYDTGDASSNMTGKNWRCHRTPLKEGFITQSMDGKPVSRLMGDVKEWDSGTLRCTVFPNFWQHTNCDYACAARLTPISANETLVRGYWLVDKDAVEGKDYELPRLLEMWDATNSQDWVICENQQAGISSPAYEPGPYSTLRERNVAHFVDWYLGEMRV